MTLRYAQHAPEPHADDDAARIEASMVGVASGEAQAVQALLKIVWLSAHKIAHSALEVGTIPVLSYWPTTSGAVAKW